MKISAVLLGFTLCLSSVAQSQELELERDLSEEIPALGLTCDETRQLLKDLSELAKKYPGVFDNYELHLPLKDEQVIPLENEKAGCGEGWYSCCIIWRFSERHGVWYCARKGCCTDV